MINPCSFQPLHSTTPSCKDKTCRCNCQRAGASLASVCAELLVPLMYTSMPVLGQPVITLPDHCLHRCARVSVGWCLYVIGEQQLISESAHEHTLMQSGRGEQCRLAGLPPTPCQSIITLVFSQDSECPNSMTEAPGTLPLFRATPPAKSDISSHRVKKCVQLFPSNKVLKKHFQAAPWALLAL